MTHLLCSIYVGGHSDSHALVTELHFQLFNDQCSHHIETSQVILLAHFSLVMHFIYKPAI